MISAMMTSSSYHSRPISIGSPLLTVLMTMATLMMMTGPVDCLSSSQQNHRFIDILAGHQQPSKLNLCMMNCGQCKQMYGEYFDGRRCAEFCLAETLASGDNDADWKIPDCNDPIAISQFLKLSSNPVSSSSSSDAIVQELVQQQPPPQPPQQSFYPSYYSSYSAPSGFGRFGSGGYTLKGKSLRRQQQEQQEYNNLMKPNRAGPGGNEPASGTVATAASSSSAIDTNSANWKKRISRNSVINNNLSPTTRFYLI